MILGRASRWFTAVPSVHQSQPDDSNRTHSTSALAWQKGQGVPQRYRKAQDQFQALVLNIEQTERAFLDQELEHSPLSGTAALMPNGKPRPRLDPRTEAARNQKMYDEARADQQANTPDFLMTTDASPRMAAREKDLEAQLAEVKDDARAVQARLIERIDGLVKGLQGSVQRNMDEVIKGVVEEQGKT
jgi:hypothetical protein